MNRIIAMNAFTLCTTLYILLQMISLPVTSLQRIGKKKGHEAMTMYQVHLDVKNHQKVNELYTCIRLKLISFY